MSKTNRFLVKKACSIIRNQNFKVITLQFPDEFASGCVDIYEAFDNELNKDGEQEGVFSLFIAVDSTYGSSIDDVSAMHINSDVIVSTLYFNFIII